MSIEAVLLAESAEDMGIFRTALELLRFYFMLATFGSAGYALPRK